MILGWVTLNAKADSLFIDYSAEPNEDLLLAYDLTILQPTSKVDLTVGQTLGNRYLAYLSVVEVSANDQDEIHQAANDLGVELLSRNQEWGTRMVDLTNPAWRNYVIHEIAASAIAKGFDGFFLDTLDSAEVLMREYPDRALEFDEALVALVSELRTAYPEVEIVVNRGFRWLDSLSQQIDGMMVESVYQTFVGNMGDYGYKPVPTSTTKLLELQIEKAMNQGLDVYVVDYVDPLQPEIAEATDEKIRDLGAIPFLTTPELQGQISGAVGEIARRILVLYGHDPDEAEDYRVFPEDTTALILLQAPLEWMGYEVEYHDVSEGLPEVGVENDYSGFILDETMKIPTALMYRYADWLIERIDEGKKVVFLGSYGFSGLGAKSKITERLRLRGDGNALKKGAEVGFSQVDESVLNYEVKPLPSPLGFEDHWAPESSDVFLSLLADGGEPHSKQRFDAIYTTSWGGAILAPYLLFDASDESRLSYIDPFAFLHRIWPGESFPVPDVTTRDGLRIFYSHIDGDGFSSLSWTAKDKTCAEVLYDEVLKDLPYPITVSIIEAEIRAHIQVMNKEDQDALEKIARKIFALTNVEPASHSYSHPYIWDPSDKSLSGMYKTLNLPLKLSAGYQEIDLEREIKGSLDYIQSTLTPEKPPKIMLWSGNCRPCLEALQIAADFGVENMNGGDTILSRRFPGITCVAPKLVSQKGLLQIYASNQNEFYYTDGWVGPYNHGFSKVVQTFEMTDEDRRLKPVNVYYHFYSADRDGGLNAIKEIYAWCQERPLHGLTAWEYAKMVRDSHFTKVFETGPGRWTVVNRGEATTMRLPLEYGVPDLAESVGITGFNRVRDWLFIHTDGSQRVELVMSDSEPNQPYLRTSTSPIEVEELAPRAITLRGGPRNGVMNLAGFPSRQSVTLKRSTGTQTTLQSDQDGMITLSVPANEPIILSF